MSIRTIKKACFLTIFIGFGILPSLSWGRNISSIYTEDSSIDKDGEIYSFSGYVGRVSKDINNNICISWKGDQYWIEKDGSVYSFPGPIGHVDPGDFVGAICLILSQK